jgi:hypothetical protein
MKQLPLNSLACARREGYGRLGVLTVTNWVDGFSSPPPYPTKWPRRPCSWLLCLKEKQWGIVRLRNAVIIGSSHCPHQPAWRDIGEYRPQVAAIPPASLSLEPENSLGCTCAGRGLASPVGPALAPERTAIPSTIPLRRPPRSIRHCARKGFRRPAGTSSRVHSTVAQSTRWAISPSTTCLTSGVHNADLN